MNEINLPKGVIDAVRKIESIKDLQTLFDNLFAEAPAKTGTDTETDSTTDYGLKKSGQKTRERINEQCRNILNKVNANNGDTDSLTKEELDILKQYSGKGGLKEGSQFEYYTPTPIAEGVWDCMKANGFTNGNVLDPCTGAGVFSATKPAGTVITGCDLDPVSSQIARILNPKDSISTGSFEDLVVATEDNSFDCAIGNVPFGDARGASAHKDTAYRDEKLCQRYFILRALDKVRPGGLVCFICPPDIVGAAGDGQWKTFRETVSEKAEFLGAHKLPSGTFSAQGTNTVVDVVVFKKHPADLLERIQNKELDRETLTRANVYWDTFIKGQYWQRDGKRFIHGEFVPKDVTKVRDSDKVKPTINNATLKSRLATKFESRIDWDLLDSVPGTIREYREGDYLFINGEQHVFKAGQWEKVFSSEKDTVLDASLFGVGTYSELQAVCREPQAFLALTPDNVSNICTSFPNLVPQGVRDAATFAGVQNEEYKTQALRGAIIGHMIACMVRDAEQGKDIEETRDRLQALVIQEYDTYGDPKKLRKLRLAGEASKAFGIFMNAIDKNGNFSALLAGKSDVSSSFDNKNPESIVSYLTSSIDGQSIEFEDFVRLYKGDVPINSIEDLAEYPTIAIDPASGHINTMGNYCCGEIYPKIDECRKFKATATPRMAAKLQTQIDEMVKRRDWTNAEDIVFSMRNKWFNKELILRFLAERGHDAIKFGVETDRVNILASTPKKTVYMFDEDIDAPNGVYYAYGYYSNVTSAIVSYLNGKKPRGAKRENLKNTEEAIARLEEDFNTWVKQQPEIANLEAEYNRKFNGYVEPPRNSEALGMDDILSGEISLHGYQNEEVRRLANLGCGICGFGTGLGKSFVGLNLAAYNLKKGNFKRTCIVVPSAVLENWYHEARQVFTEDFMRKRVFVVGLEPKRDKQGNVQRQALLDEYGKPRMGKDGQPLQQDVLRTTSSKQQIFEQMWAIPGSNYSIIVMTKEKFASVPVEPDLVEEYTSTMVSKNLIRENKKQEGGYKEDKRRRKLEEKFSDTGRKKAGELPTLELMGIDSIITDESHFFKNSLDGGDNTRDVMFIPNAPTSQLARDMSIKSYYVKKLNGGKGVYGLTATPVTNSPLEIFNMLSLIADPAEFEAKGVDTPDRFIQFFANITRIDRSLINGEVEEQRAVVGFKQLDALRSIFRKYCNIKTVKDVDNEIHVPTQVDHNEQVENTPLQRAEYERLRNIARKQGDVDPKERIPIFSIIRDMDRVSTDTDMFYHTITFSLDKKYKAQAEQAVEEVKKAFTKGMRAEFLIKSGLKEKVAIGIVREEPPVAEVRELQDGSLQVVAYEVLEDKLLAAFKSAGIVDSAGNTDVGHPVPPKYAKLIANVEKYMKTEPVGKQIIFSDEKSQHRKLQRILERNVNGLEPGKTGIINAEEASGVNLDKIAKAYNSGGLWIVIANKKAEVGVNLQKGTVAIHHLTLPWTPASINQRNGRGVRQGNVVGSVDVYYYLGKDTFDEYRQGILQGKANWIGQLLQGNELQAENADAATADEMAVMLAENPEEQRRIIAEQKAKKAQEEALRRRRAHGSNLGQYLTTVRRLSTLDEEIDKKIEAQRNTLASLKAKITNAQAELEWALKVENAQTEKKSREIIESSTARIAVTEARINGLSNSREVQRQELEGLVRRLRLDFESLQARGEELPFNFSDIVGNESEYFVFPSTGMAFRQGERVLYTDERMGKSLRYFSFTLTPKPQCYLTLHDNPESHKRDLYPNDYDKVSPAAEFVAAENAASEQKLLTEMNLNYYDAVKDIRKLGEDRFLEYSKQQKIHFDPKVLIPLEDREGNITIGHWAPDLADKWASFPRETGEWRKKVVLATAKKYREVTDNEEPSLQELFSFDHISFLVFRTRSVTPLLRKAQELADKEASSEELADCLVAAFNRRKSEAVQKMAKKGYTMAEIAGTLRKLWKKTNDLPIDIGEGSKWVSVRFSKKFVLEEFNSELLRRSLKQVPSYMTNPVLLDTLDNLEGQLILDAEKAKKETAAAKSRSAREARRVTQQSNASTAETSGTESPGQVDQNNQIEDATRKALAEKGIQIFVNNLEFVIAWKRTSRTNIPAGSAYMLFDENGYQGVLRARKNSLKADFGAKYTTDYPGDPGKSFWVIPVGRITQAQLREILG